MPQVARKLFMIISNLEVKPSENVQEDLRDSNILKNVTTFIWTLDELREPDNDREEKKRNHDDDDDEEDQEIREKTV